MLNFSPSKRITAQEAMKHAFFRDYHKKMTLAKAKADENCD